MISPASLYVRMYLAYKQSDTANTCAQWSTCNAPPPPAEACLCNPVGNPRGVPSASPQPRAYPGLWHQVPDQLGHVKRAHSHRGDASNKEHQWEDSYKRISHGEANEAGTTAGQHKGRWEVEGGNVAETARLPAGAPQSGHAKASLGPYLQNDIHTDLAMPSSDQRGRQHLRGLQPSERFV